MRPMSWNIIRPSSTPGVTGPARFHRLGEGGFKGLLTAHGAWDQYMGPVYIPRWWFQMFFLMFKPGEMIQFDAHSFQRGFAFCVLHSSAAMELWRQTVEAVFEGRHVAQAPPTPRYVAVPATPAFIRGHPDYVADVGSAL